MVKWETKWWEATVIYMGEKKELKIKHPGKARTRVHIVGDCRDWGLASVLWAIDLFAVWNYLLFIAELSSISHFISLLFVHLHLKAFISFSMLIVFFCQENSSRMHLGLLLFFFFCGIHADSMWGSDPFSKHTVLFLKEELSECAVLNQNPEVNEKAKCAVWWFPYTCPLSLTGISCLSCWRCFYREVSIKVNHPWALFIPQGISFGQLGINLVGTL